MKHIFIINPKSGHSDSSGVICRRLNDLHNQGKLADYEVHITTAPQEATTFVRERCRNLTEPTRFYACGRDGTLNEVCSGLIGCELASLACYPCGSGNDFIKYFGEKERFCDFEKQIAGTEQRIDLLRVEADGRELFSINVINYGLESAVAQTAQSIKRRPLMGGKAGYAVGAAKAFICSMKTSFRMIADGTELPEREMLLCTLANGSHVGSMLRCAPRACVDDGLLELCLFRPISRLNFIRFIGRYIHGRHLDSPAMQRFIHYDRCRRVEIMAAGEGILTVDGESVAGARFAVEVLPSAVSFCLPAE